MAEILDLIEDWAGYHVLNDRKHDETYARKMIEAESLLTNAKGMASHRWEYELREALGTADFPYLFGDVLDRQLLADYKAVEPVWKAFTKTSTVRRIHPQVGGYRFAIYGGDQYLDLVGQKGEYLASQRDELRYQITVYKRGRQFDISWEAMINDDLGALNDTPMRFAKAAVRTEHRIVTGLYAGNFGAHVEGHGGFLYEAAINAFVDLLTIGNLENAVQRMMEFTDIGGEPIMTNPKYLVVPPALKFTAMQILTSANKMWVATGDTDVAAAPYPTNNVISQEGIVLIVDPYLPVMDTTDGDTGWYLFCAPGDLAALEFAHLQGHESPEIAMKASDKVSTGGGAASPFSGDFATDNVFYRVRHVSGGTALDWRATYMGGAVNAIGG